MDALGASGRSWAADDPTEPLTVPGPPRRRGGAAVARQVRSAAARWLRRLVPASWSGARIDPGRPGAIALTLVAAVAAVAAAAGVWLDRPRAEPVAGPAAGSVPGLALVTGAGSAAATPVPAAGPLVVSVSGKVRRPGLVRVPDGARVADVLDAAGGALPGTDLSGLNLARKAVDGEQIAVGVPPAPDAGTATPGTPAGGPGPVDLNTATVSQLDALPGIGPATAQKIIDWRGQHGRFARIEQLREVPGIGERKFDQLRGLVRV